MDGIISGHQGVTGEEMIVDEFIGKGTLFCRIHFLRG
jgi:hypothetical protein